MLTKTTRKLNVLDARNTFLAEMVIKPYFLKDGLPTPLFARIYSTFFFWATLPFMIVTPATLRKTYRKEYMRYADRRAEIRKFRKDELVQNIGRGRRPNSGRNDPPSSMGPSKKAVISSE